MTIALMVIPRSTFPLGEVVMTANASATLDFTEIWQGLTRHASGDWGDIPEEDREQNQLALQEGMRLMSVYGEGKTRFWIITEADRSVTTVLMPEDY